MEDITSYHFIWDDNVCLVPISLLLLTKPIINAAKQAGANLKSLSIKMQPNEQGFALSRTNRVIDAMNNHLILPPIMIKKYNNTSFYEIIDGRHRVAISLANNYTHIPAIIKS